MANTMDYHHQDIAITICKCAWLPTKHFKLPLPSNHKFVGPFRVLCAISYINLQFQLLDGQTIHNAFHANYLKPAISVVDTLAAPLWPEADNSGKFKVQDIMDSYTETLQGYVVEQFLLH